MNYLHKIMGLVAVGTECPAKDCEFPPDDQLFPLDGGFGARLKAARLAAGFKSPRALSVRVGLSDGTVKSYETGGQEPKLSVLVKLSIACRVSIDWLATGNGPMAYPHVGDTLASGEVIVQGPAIPIPESSSQLFGRLDVDRAAKALRAVENLFRLQNATPTDRERGQAFTLIYQYLALQDDVKSSDNNSIESK